MELQEPGSVAILPAGALGVAFFHHLTRGGEALGPVVFADRPGSASGRALREGAVLRLALESGEIRQIGEPELWCSDLKERAAEGWLPELILVCTQPDQLLSVISNQVQLLQWLFARYPREMAVEQWPTLILCSNGIYFQRVRQFLLEKLEEGTLLGRLPDLWPNLMPRIVGKLVRGVTIQTGQREGRGPDAIYRPGARGRTRLAGGNPEVRERSACVLTSLGGWFEAAEDASPTRVEFDKALVNLTVNLMGQLKAIDESGRFQALKIREILTSENEAETRELVRRVVEVGKAVHAYREEEEFETQWEEMLNSCRQYMEHIPSSLQWIEFQLRQGALDAKLTPTEKWLLEPLIRYAHAAGLEEAEQYFESLTQRVEAKLALAAAPAKKKGGT